MIGDAYHTPYFLAQIENEIFNNQNVPSRQEVIEKLIPYIKMKLKGTRINQQETYTWIISWTIRRKPLEKISK